LDDEEQEAEEKGAGKEGQAGSAPPAGESVGGGAAAAPPLSETVAVEREQEQPDHEEGVEEEGEFISLVQKPEAVEEDAGVARLFGSRGEEESGFFVFDRVHHTFCFSPPKRGRKLSNEDQVKMKRSKSLERKDERAGGAGGEAGLVWSRGVLFTKEGGMEEISPQVLLLGVFFYVLRR
jgi:hypothetical protein